MSESDAKTGVDEVKAIHQNALNDAIAVFKSRAIGEKSVSLSFIINLLGGAIKIALLGY